MSLTVNFPTSCSLPFVAPVFTAQNGDSPCKESAPPGKRTVGTIATSKKSSVLALSFLPVCRANEMELALVHGRLPSQQDHEVRTPASVLSLKRLGATRYERNSSFRREI